MKTTRQPQKLVADSFQAPATWTLGIRTVSELNRRDHWRVVAKRKKDQAFLVGWGIGQYRFEFTDFANQFSRYEVRLTRLGGRKLDTDNLASAFKAIRDEVCRLLGVDDGDKRVRVAYGQEIGGPVGVKIQLEAIGE